MSIGTFSSNFLPCSSSLYTKSLLDCSTHIQCFHIIYTRFPHQLPRQLHEVSTSIPQGFHSNCISSVDSPFTEHLNPEPWNKPKNTTERKQNLSYVDNIKHARWKRRRRGPQSTATPFLPLVPKRGVHPSWRRSCNRPHAIHIHRFIVQRRLTHCVADIQWLLEWHLHKGVDKLESWKKLPLIQVLIQGRIRVSKMLQSLTSSFFDMHPVAGYALRC